MSEQEVLIKISIALALTTAMSVVPSLLCINALDRYKAGLSNKFFVKLAGVWAGGYVGGALVGATLIFVIDHATGKK